MSKLEPELLAAFAQEFRQGAERLAVATEMASANRLLANLRPMVEAAGLPALHLPLETATAAVEAGDFAALAAAAARMGTALDEALSPDAPPDAAPARRRVLVVDDSPTMRRLLRTTMEQDAAFEVIGEAADGAEALARAAASAPDLILLDIEMPGMDGIAMLRRWALEGSGAVLVVSSAAAPGSARTGEVRRLGAAGVTGKPSGALSPDLEVRRGAALRAAARRALNLPPGGDAGA